MTTLLAVDPSIRAMGWATFDDGQLIGAGVENASSGVRVSITEQVLRSLRLVDQLPGGIDTLVSETPQVYPGPSEEDPNDLLPMAWQVGQLTARYRHSLIYLYHPREWKGQASKEAFQPRILERLSAEELALLPVKTRARKWPYDHNMTDAIGIGLYHLGRLERRYASVSDIEAKGLTIYRRDRVPKRGARAPRRGDG